MAASRRKRRIIFSLFLREIPEPIVILETGEWTYNVV
jgi:hypothetical protein